MVTERIGLMKNLPSKSQAAKKAASFIVSCLANPGLHVPHDVTLLACFYLGPLLLPASPQASSPSALTKRSVPITTITFVPLWLILGTI